MFERIASEIDVDRLSQDNEIAGIVQLIQHHEREILELRKRLNPLLPAARDIPDDILVEIFYHSIRMARHDGSEYSGSYSKYEEYPEMQTWWPVPLVCQRWRELVMSHPRLWSFITSGDRPEYVRRAIERSANAGLQIRLFSSYSSEWSYNPEIFQELLGQLPRAYTLQYQFESYPDEIDNHIHTLGSLPRIQTLYLRGTGDSSFGEDEVQADPLAQFLVAAPLPCLETLILVNPPVYLFDIIKHPTITFLEIDHDTRFPRRLELGSLLNALGGLPLLKVLRIRSWPSEAEHRDNFELGQVKVHFSHLQELSLDTGAETCLRLLSLISFRPQVNIFIFSAGVCSSSDGQMKSGPVGLTAQIMERLKSLQFGHWSPPYRLTLANEHLFAGNAMVIYTTQLSSRSGHTLGFRAFLDHAEGQGGVIQRLPLEHVETVVFHDLGHTISTRCNHIDRNVGGYVASTDFDSHWARMIAASSLVYSGSSHSCNHFLQSFAGLKPTLRDPKEFYHPCVPLPQVRILTLVGVEVGSDSTEHIFETLSKMLRKRREDGVPIEVLVWCQNEDQEPKFTRSIKAALLETLHDVNVTVILDLPISD